jgi:uncharacterized protein YndB with AHSA1/START domain
MNRTLLFDFTLNKKSNIINVKREFAANLELVWNAWTDPEILDQWWAPKPYRTQTKSFDFRVGFKEGFTMALGNLDELLSKSNQLQIIALMRN